MESECKKCKLLFCFPGNIFTKLMYNSMKKVILFSIVAILVGCQSQKNLMLNNQWKLTELNGKNLTGENVEITLTFNTSNHQVNGNGGCNRYFGGYKLIDNTIEISNLGSTKIFCAETGNFEDEYFNTLKDKSNLKVIENQLIFSRQGKNILIFQKKIIDK